VAVSVVSAGLAVYRDCGWLPRNFVRGPQKHTESHFAGAQSC